MLRQKLKGVVPGRMLSCYGLAFFLSASTLSAQDTMVKDLEPTKTGIKGFVELFNGKDLAGWKNVYDHGEVKVVNGEVHMTGDKKFFLTTEKTYTDFEMTLEIMLPAKGPANSGVMFRAQVDKTKPKHKVWGYQAECDPTKRAYSGRIYDEGRRKWDLLTEEQKMIGKNVQAPYGEWIGYRIVCKGDRIQVWVDGQLTSDLKDTKDAEGVIGLQHHGETGKLYRFKNIKLKEL